MPRPGESGDRLSEPLRSQAEKAGLIMRPPTLTPNSMYSLEATEYAQQKGRFMEFHKAAYRALWEDRQDLGNLDVIKAVAAIPEPQFYGGRGGGGAAEKEAFRAGKGGGRGGAKE